MVAPSLTKSLMLLALGFSHQAIAACTRSVAAKKGDTCATLASQAGITVTDFLRSNPSVTSCSELVVGRTYCVDGTNDSGSTAPPTSSAPAELQVSTDGTCGQGLTCSGSRFGNCCSAHGFCGSTSDYCGDGCQAGFGSCDAGGEVTSPAAPPVTITVTSVVTKTQGGGTATVTQTVKTTETFKTTATIPVTSIVRLTTIVTSITTSVSTRTVNVTSLSVDTITSIVTSTRVVTSAACNTTPTKTTGHATTPTQPPEGRPTLPGTPSNCKNLDSIEHNDTCRSIATRNNLSLLQFYQLNPSINCDALWEGYYVCVGR